ncbi:MAG: cytochrome c-type biogenesis protein CcmH, partial [Candidatus Lindowbacteria bacterium]|nr:cytochrome c-type biogenesis protein CcmH [Candidatus Lindowbacteria bacterium]
AHFAGTNNWMAELGFGIAVFIISATFTDVYIVARARQKSTKESLVASAANLIERNQRRYGGFLAHIGMAILLIGLAGNAFNMETEKYLAPGESLEFENYRVQYDGYDESNDGHRDYFRAKLTLFRDGKNIGTSHPEISVYFPGEDREIRNSEVAIHSTLFEDAYLIFAEPQGERGLIRLMINPLITFFWVGTLVTVLGSILALVPWRFPRYRSPKGTAAVMILFLLAIPASAQEYSRAIGNRDPVAQQLTCQCSCNMPLDKCDMASCHSSGNLLDELAGLRLDGLDDAAMVKEMAVRHTKVILNAPPKEGFHWIGWILPFALFLIGLLGLSGWLLMKKSSVSDSADASLNVKKSDLDAIDVALKDQDRRFDEEEI